jgi:hypothetical protein
MARSRFCSFYIATKELAPIPQNDMNNHASDWLVLIRPLVAGFDSTRDSRLMNLPEFVDFGTFVDDEINKYEMNVTK